MTGGYLTDAQAPSYWLSLPWQRRIHSTVPRYDAQDRFPRFVLRGQANHGMTRVFEMASSPQGATAPAIDPICGMKVDTHTAKWIHEHGDIQYCFCCKGCREKFSADPAKYLEKSAPLHPPAPLPSGEGRSVMLMVVTRGHEGHGGAQYTCPMHPEIVQVGPGSCPKCGMALVPIAGTGRGGRFRAARPHAAAVDRRRAVDSARGARDGADGRHPRAVRPRAAGARLGRVRARHAGRAVGRLADPAQVLAVARAPRRSTCTR